MKAFTVLLSEDQVDILLHLTKTGSFEGLNQPQLEETKILSCLLNKEYLDEQDINVFADAFGG